MNKSIRDRCNSFSARIILMVMVGIILIAVTVSTVVLQMSREVFSETYGESQEKVFDRIENEVNDFHTNLRKIVESVESSWAFRLYLKDENKLDNVENFRNIYQMEMDLNKSKSSDMERLNILIIGMNDKHYLSRTETISMGNEEILQSEAVQKSLKEPDSILYTYAKGAYTSTTKDIDVMIASKALKDQESGSIYGVLLVTLTMEDMKRYYDYFITDNTSWYLVDGEDVVLCSDKNQEVGYSVQAGWYKDAKDREEYHFLTKEDGRLLTILKKELPFLGCCMYGVIDNGLALNKLYNMPLLIGICAAIGTVILLVCLWFVQKTTSPLSEMVRKMSKSRTDNFMENMPVKGTREVRQLAVTYNDMLNDIHSYVDELLDTQKAQRKAEIKALQMQINPHYIYNTLASIKWLVYQNDEKKVTQTIDAFISLLRNTISNTDEFITIQQELINIENYILINHTRYGDAVKVEYYVSRNCYDCLIPKMILQPFIENVFFHAFPEGRSGVIQIFMNVKNDILEIRIVDNGVGMNAAKARDAVTQKKEHFSGIGIHNIQERLKLLYGAEYGVTIDSAEEKGTCIHIHLPIRKVESFPENESGEENEDEV